MQGKDAGGWITFKLLGMIVIKVGIWKKDGLLVKCQPGMIKNYIQQN